MVVVFDTDVLPVADRVEATVAAMQDQSVPSTVILLDDIAVRSRMEVWNFGTASIFQAEMTGFRLRRTAAQARRSPGEYLGIALHDRCVGQQEQYETQRLVPPGALMITDHNAPYEYELGGPGKPYCLFVRIDELGLPPDVVRVAASRLSTSPMHNMVANHITALTRRADELSSSSVASRLGEVSVDLVRALIASAYDTDYARGVMTEVLLPRIRGYIRTHLGDPLLSADSIAHAHGISVRKLFRIFGDAGVSLEQWIVASRLEGAREDLARLETSHLSIAVIARRWGFANPSHFGRRFRETYGLSPRAWRELVEQGSATTLDRQ